MCHFKKAHAGKVQGTLSNIFKTFYDMEFNPYNVSYRLVFEMYMRI